MSQSPFVLAIANYDRHGALLAGDFPSIAGRPLTVLEVGQSVTGKHGQARHRRMLVDLEFDAAEVSLSSFLVAKANGSSLVGLPIFPRRLFSFSQYRCLSSSPITDLAGLKGKRVGINSFHTTLSVLARADMMREGIDWREVDWVAQRPNDIASTKQASCTVLRAGESVVEHLFSGSLDAVLLPHPPRVLLASPNVRRLLPDARERELAYIQTYGYWPIMHVLALQQQYSEPDCDVPVELVRIFEKSKEKTIGLWDDPNWSSLAWGMYHWELDTGALGRDPMPNGMATNVENLSWFIDQMVEQGMLSSPLPVDNLLLDVKAVADAQ